MPGRAYLQTLHLGKRDPDGVPLQRAGVLRHEGLGRFLFALKQDEGLPLAVHLEQLRADDRAVLRQMGKERVLGDVLWEGRDVDHLGWSTAMPVVLHHVAVEAVQA